MDNVPLTRHLLINELSNVKHTKRKERESLRKIQDNKKNKRMTNLRDHTFEIYVRDIIAVVMYEYNELVYATVKVVTELSSFKRKRKVNG